MTETRSPSSTRVTPGPTAMTSPANSWPRICGFWAPVSGCGSTGVTIGPATYSWRSVPQMPHVATRTTTSPSPGASGSATSSIRRSRAAWKRRPARLSISSARTISARPVGSWHDPLGPQSGEQVHERRLRVAHAGEAESPASAHVREGLDGSSQICVGMPPRGQPVDAQISRSPWRRTISGQTSTASAICCSSGAGSPVEWNRLDAEHVGQPRPQPAPPEDVPVDDVEAVVGGGGCGRRPDEVISEEPRVGDVGDRLPLLPRAWKVKPAAGLTADRSVDSERDAHVHRIPERPPDQRVGPMHRPRESVALGGGE